MVLNDPALLDRAQVYQWPADLSALLAVPLHANGEVIGVPDVVNKAGGFSAEDVPVMSVFANQAAMAIEHAWLEKHAGARHVSLHLRYTAENISLEVSDDGVGFDPLAVPPEGRGGAAQHQGTRGVPRRDAGVRQLAGRRHTGEG